MQNDVKYLPDITAKTSYIPSSPIQWVGMEAIDLPIKIDDNFNAMVNAQVNTFVDLRTDDKGIHMSRLYLKLQSHLSSQQLSTEAIDNYLADVLASHPGKSVNAKVSFRFSLMTEKPALLTDNKGYQAYTIEWTRRRLEGVNTSTIAITIPYSSTCPNSAALARQLTADKIDASFSSNTIDKTELIAWLQDETVNIATPHNQRSFAYIILQVNDAQAKSLSSLVRTLEQAIGTPLQTAVKRLDEQAFAELNGNNLLFCEDAARRLKQCIANMSQVDDYWFKVEHQESLHPHNAVAIDFKHSHSASLMYL